MGKKANLNVAGFGKFSSDRHDRPTYRRDLEI
jgi:hypothetical protein